MTDETVRFRARCDMPGCGGVATWTGTMLREGGGTSYRISGCSECPETGDVNASGRNENPDPGVVTQQTETLDWIARTRRWIGGAA